MILLLCPQSPEPSLSCRTRLCSMMTPQPAPPPVPGVHHSPCLPGLTALTEARRAVCVLCGRRISLNVRSPRFIHAVGAPEFVAKAEERSVARALHILFLHLFTHGHQACFHSLAIVTSAALNTSTQISLQNSAFKSLYTHRSGILDRLVTL